MTDTLEAPAATQRDRSIHPPPGASAVVWSADATVPGSGDTQRVDQGVFRSHSNSVTTSDESNNDDDTLIFNWRARARLIAG